MFFDTVTTAFAFLVAATVVAAQIPNGSPVAITVVITTDDSPLDIGWILFDSSNGILVDQVAIGTYTEAFSNVTTIVPVTEGGAYTLQLQDASGNGICCSNGNGDVLIYYGEEVNHENLLGFSRGEYGGQEYINFQASAEGTIVVMPSAAPSAPTTVPSLSPSSSLAPSTSAAPSDTQIPVVITIAIWTDQFPDEIAWVLFDGNRLEVASFDSYVRPFSLELTTVVVTRGNEYTLRLIDDFGDGICCTDGAGEARVYLGFPEFSPLVYSDGQYGLFREYTFLASEEGVISVPPTIAVPPILFPVSSCSICGEGNQVGDPDAIFDFPGQPSVSCGTLEQLGEMGLIALNPCSDLPPLIGVCECGPSGSMSAVAISPATFATAFPVASPSRNPAFSPSQSPANSQILNRAQSCAVCGDGKQVGNPDAIFDFPGQPSLPCGLLEQVAEMGLIPVDQCPFLPPIIGVCECAPSLSMSPITASPIVAPSRNPAFSPSQSPANSPTLFPAPETCAVCGDGKQVGNPDAIFDFPGQPSVACGILEQLGEMGLIALDPCSVLPRLLGVCECTPSGSPVFPVASPSRNPAFSPSQSPANSPTPFPAPGTCVVCGEGRQVGNPDAFFEFPGLPSAPCGLLEQIGEMGILIPVDACPFLPGLLGVCECTPSGSPVFPVASPSRNPAFSPSQSPANAPIIFPAPGTCVICGEGKQVGNPDAVFEFPGMPDTPCGLLEQIGEMGLIPVDQCPFLPPIIGVCECAPSGTSMGPVAVSPATFPPAFPAPSRNPAFSPSQSPANSQPLCVICGAGKQVGKPDAVFEFPGQPGALCGVLEQVGEMGLIPVDACPFLPGLLGVCECTPSGSPVFPVASPSRNPAFSPTPFPAPGTCVVCGEGRQVGNPDAFFEFPGLPSAPCGLLEELGQMGLISVDECPFLPSFIGGVCECEPSAGVSPSFAPPSQSPFNSPTMFPTFSPPASNDACNNAEPTVSGGSPQIGSTLSSTIESLGTVPFCGTAITSPGVWYSIVGNDGQMTVDTCSSASNFDTKISVYEGECDSLDCVSGNDNFSATECNGGKSSVTWQARAGVEYKILVHGFGGQSGTFELTISTT